MILADTSVWIDFFRSKDSIIKETLQSLIKDNNQICLCGIVLQEILQGIHQKDLYLQAKSRLLAFPYIDTDLDTYLLAASIYRKLSSKGKKAPTIDTLISALAIENNMPIFTLDKHFDEIEKYSNLKMFHY